MSSRPGARIPSGVVPGPCLEFRGVRVPELLELRQLLAGAGLSDVRLVGRPGPARGTVVAVAGTAPSAAALHSWQLWTLPTALVTALPGLALAIVATPRDRTAAALGAAVDAARLPPGRTLHRIRGPLMRAPVLPLDALAAAAGAATASEAGVLATLATLRRDPRACDLLVAGERTAPAIAAALRRLAGPGVLATALRLHRDRACVRSAQDGATGLVLATSRALEVAGRPAASRALLAALLAALEDGVTPAGLPHRAPRRRCTNDAAFLAAVRERLGARPRWLSHPLAAAPSSPRDRAAAPAPVRRLRSVAGASRS